MTEAIPPSRTAVFDCAGEVLVGIIHEPAVEANLGVVFVVGGPQYRTGSHRQFTLMARALTIAGYPVFRFDHRGIGDSDGEPRSFEEIGDDISAAIRFFRRTQPAVKGVVLLGLCDAASAILNADLTEEPVVGLVLINPWVRTPAGEASAYLSHYYGSRFRDFSFWRNLIRGRVRIGESLRIYFSARRQASLVGRDALPHFVRKMCDSLGSCRRPVLLITSGRDLVASEFLDLSHRHETLRRALGAANVKRVSLPTADHTFSARLDLDCAINACRQWLDDLILPVNHPAQQRAP